MANICEGCIDNDWNVDDTACEKCHAGDRYFPATYKEDKYIPVPSLPFIGRLQREIESEACEHGPCETCGYRTECQL